MKWELAFLILLLPLLLISSVSAEDVETIFPCQGDGQLYGECLGDDQLSIHGGLIEQGFGNIDKGIEKGYGQIIFYLCILVIILIIIIVIWEKNRKNEK